jgi:hypothetical protein
MHARRKQHALVAFWLCSTFVLLFQSALFSQTFNDASGDTFVANSVLDIRSVSVSFSTDRSRISFRFNLGGNPSVDFSGKYCLGIRMVGNATTSGNAWNRPIFLGGGMTHWIGSWVDAGGGCQLWRWTGSGWANAGAPDLVVGSSYVTITCDVSSFTGNSTSPLLFDAYVSTGGPGQDHGAVDALSTSSVPIATILGAFTSTSLKTVVLVGAPTLLSPGIPDATSWQVNTLAPVFSWQAVSGASGYGLYIRDLTTDTLIYDDDFVSGGTTQLQLPASLLVAGRSYRWNMRARDSSGNWSAFSAPFYFNTAANPFSAPGPLEAQFFSDRVELGWTDNTTNETGFEVERRTGSGSWSRIGTPSALSGSGGSRFFTDRTVQPRTSYSYRVRAVKSGTNSDYSNEATGTTPGGIPGAFVLSTQLASGPSVVLSWTTAQDAGGYTVYRNGSVLPGGGGVTSPFTDSSSLVPGTTYSYVIRASNADGTKDSNTVQVTIPSGVVVPTISAIEPAIIPGIDGQQTFTLRGQSFDSGARVTLRTGSESYLIPTSRTQRVSSSEIRVTANLTSTPANWTAEVANPGGSPSGPFGFAVGAVAVSPTGAIDFGTIQVGATSDRTVTLRNTAGQPVSWTATAGGVFSVVGVASGSIPASGEQSVLLRYAPSAAGAHSISGRFVVGGQTHTRELNGRSATAAPTTGVLTGTVVVAQAGSITNVPNAEVFLRAPGGNQPLTGQIARTGPTGAFTLSNAPVGNYEVVAKPPSDSSRFFGSAVSAAAIAATNDPITLTLPSLPAGLDPAFRPNYPVVLVRGIGERGKDELKYWEAMRTALTNDGYVVWDPNEFQITLDGEMPPSWNAAKLKAYLMTKCDEFKWAHNEIMPLGIHIIAHSMGGLTAREMLSDLRFFQDMPPVRTLVTLSTPHAGAHAANPSGNFLFGILWPKDWASTRSLKTDLIRTTFKPEFPKDRPPRLFLAGGNTSGDPLLYPHLTLSGAYIFNVAEFGDEANDGAVTLKSSAGRYNDWLGREHVAFQEGQYQIADGRASAPFKPFALNHSTIIEDFSVINWVKDILRGGIGTAAPAAASVPRTLQIGATSTEPTWQNVEAISFTLPTSATETRTLPLTGEGAARWVISLANTNVVLRLAKPGGGWIAGPEPGVTWNSLDNPGTGERMVTVTIDSPQAGSWGVEFNGASLTAPAACSFFVQEDSALSLQSTSSALVNAGAWVPLLASVTLNNPPPATSVTGGTVTAEVTAPDGTSTNLALTDSGVEGDGASGDGTHGLFASGFAASGLYSVLLRYDGTHPGNSQPVRRVARSGFQRSSGAGFIASIAGFRTVDADNDGYPEAIILDVPVEVAVAGAFKLAGTLSEVGGDGQVNAVTDFERSASGSGMVNLVFDVRGLPQGRESGPFELSELRLIRNDGDREWLHDYPPGYPVDARLRNTFSRVIRLTGDLNFGAVRTGGSASRMLRIHNDGWQSMDVGVTLGGEISGNFQGIVDPGEYTEVEIRYEPTSVGAQSGTIQVQSNANDGTGSAAWTGSGIDGIAMADWLASRGVPAEQRGASDDPNSDGLRNILAYLFNVAPIGELSQSDHGALPQTSMGEDANGRYLALRYRHNADATGLTVGLQGRGRLDDGTWMPQPPDETVNVGTDPQTGDPIKEMRVRIGGQQSFFLRMTASQSP